jgi:GMP synthase (glutamine-hydrolysing)
MTGKILQVAVLSHLPFEDLGSLGPELLRRGFMIHTIEAAAAKFPVPEIQDSDLLVVLGGPIGVYDADDYPFLTAEIDGLRRRLEAGKPTLGICLGAQLMAAALGARVYPGERGSEIGWFPLLPVAGSAGSAGPAGCDWFSPLLADNLKLFHWHGDTFDLPQGALPLARTALYENQAFAIGDFALGLQFHPEVTDLGLERWYVGHSCELRQKDISVKDLRADARKCAPALEKAAGKFWGLWLDYIL